MVADSAQCRNQLFKERGVRTISLLGWAVASTADCCAQDNAAH